MSVTAHESAREKEELFDSAEVLDKKVRELAHHLKNSRHAVAFTGAGISTACGIPDFRSGIGTVLPTGPGCWELKAQAKVNPGAAAQASAKSKRKSVLKAIPSYTHMCLVALERAGYIKFVVSQNVDGLHRRSGLDRSKLAELHGNTNLEVCSRCKKEYMRDFRTRTAMAVHDHRTGRRCGDGNCRGELLDSIINFGENLPEKDINAAFEHAAKADLCIALGSSLKVTPAADVPAEVAERGGRLVVVNLQRTPLDRVGVRINGMCDEVMQRLANHLEVDVHTWRLQRYVSVSSDGGYCGGHLKIEGRDSGDKKEPYSLFKTVEFLVQDPDASDASTPPSAPIETVALKDEPSATLRLDASRLTKLANTASARRTRPHAPDTGKGIPIAARLHFRGHYSEPPITLPPVRLATIDEGKRRRITTDQLGTVTYLLELDIATLHWSITQI